jgi:tetratricopeptide (TPR) repeat protein
MWHRRALLRVDPFTLSAGGRPWVDLHWLFQLGATLIHRAAGLLGIAVAQASLVAGGAVLLARTAERAAGPVARDGCAVALLGGLFLARHLLAPRPVILTLVGLACFLWVLESWRAGRGTPRPWLWLPLIQVVWVNCQGLAPLGPALLAAYLAGAGLERILRGRHSTAAPAPPLRPLALALLLCALASLVTPYGLAATVLPAELLSRILPRAGNLFSTAVAENVPPFVLERTAPEQAAYFKWTLLALGLAFALARPRLRLAHLLVLVAFGGLAAMANRNVLLFFWVAAPVGAIALAPAAARRIQARLATERQARVARVAAVSALAAALAVELALVGLVRAREPLPGTLTPFHFPAESVRRLAERGVSGPVFAPDRHGGYLELALPSVQPYIDTRLVLHSADEYAAYLALFEDPARFDALDRRYRFAAVVLTTAYPDLYLGLVRHLAEDPAWHLVYTDGYQVLFLRQGSALALGDPATIAEISNALAARHGASPASSPTILATARLHLARLLIVLGQWQRAEEVLAALDSRAAARLRARALLAAGRWSAAETLARILVGDDPRDIRSLTLLAEVALARGAESAAADWLRRALAINPYDTESRALLDRMAPGGARPR